MSIGVTLSKLSSLVIVSVGERNDSKKKRRSVIDTVVRTVEADESMD